MDLNTLDFIASKDIQALKKSGVITVLDLLTNYPTRFINYTVIPVSKCIIGENVTIDGICEGKASVFNAKNNLSIMNFYIESDGFNIKVTIFNRHFLRSKIHYGKYVRLTGKFDKDYSKFIANEISFDELTSDVVAVYNIKGITDSRIREIKEKVYFKYNNNLVDYLPKEIIDEYKLISYDMAIKFINIPDSIDEVEEAKKRLKFEEILKYQLKVKYMLYVRKNYPEGISINYDINRVNSFIDKLPYELTIDQEKSKNEILKDISSTYKMNRLLQGEVGSGKTVVAAIALLAVVSAKYQGAIMVPTEVLANQHYQTFKKMFDNEGISISLLTSSIPSKERKEILRDLELGKINILIGTHSLFQKDVTFHKLGLVVTDEEHRFGVRQRVSLVGKGYLIDHLKMSATPIPRTLAISLLGDSDISFIKTMPGKKKEVITKFLDYNHRHSVFEHIKEEVKRGRQVYIITPMINESDIMDLRNAIDVFENTKKYYKDIAEVGLIHGKLSTQEKNDVMNKFENNEIQILISTSVIEVGVNVVNATSIVILDADRFGIAQLHQMRGRVRRSDYQSYCFLISKAENESAIKRLKLVESTSDGFVLAEADLLNRGAGDIFGERQTGNIDFKLANLIEDKELLEEVNLLADSLFESKRLFTDDYKLLLEMAHNNYQLTKENLE